MLVSILIIKISCFTFVFNKQQQQTFAIILYKTKTLFNGIGVLTKLN